MEASTIQSIHYEVSLMKTLVTCIIVALGSFCCHAASAEAPRPNVILIFIDDMGYGDVGFNGATVPKTPNLDQMAAEGHEVHRLLRWVCGLFRFTNRAADRLSLPTSQHERRCCSPTATAGCIPTKSRSPTCSRDAGYRTACIGKWHLGHLPPCLPTYQGFDSYWGIPYSNDMWIDPANKLAADIVIREGLTLADLKAGHKAKNVVPILRNEEVIEYPADQTTITRRYTEEAIRFINEKREQPFFLYLPHTMVHLPLAVSKAFDNPDNELITNAIEEVDWSVGEILKSVKAAGIADNTLIIFTSDNGAAVGSSLPLRAKKGSVYDGGIREPTLMWWPGKIPAGSVCSEVAASIDMMPTLAALCGGDIARAKNRRQGYLAVDERSRGCARAHTKRMS